MMTDETSPLRQRLEDGDWRALLDPLVSLVLLSDPGPWWRQASNTCRLALIEHLVSLLSPEARVAALDDWRHDVVPGPLTWMSQWSLEAVPGNAPRAFTKAMFQMLTDGQPRFHFPDNQHCVVRALLAHLPAEHRAVEGQQAATALAVLEQWSVR